MPRKQKADRPLPTPEEQLREWNKNRAMVGMAPLEQPPILATLQLPHTQVLMIETLFVNDDDGWLRVTRGDEGKTWFCKWKFKQGRWRGHYVMSVAPIGSLRTALENLSKQVQNVRDGLRKPTVDKAYEFDEV